MCLKILIRAVQPPQGDGKRRGAPALSVGDARVLADTVPGTDAVSMRRTAPAEATADAHRAMATLAGVTVSWRSTVDIDVVRGRWLSPDDEATRRRVAVLGSDIARELFGNEVPSGIRIAVA